MARERIISEVTSAEDAKKVEETVKTGYAEPLLESLDHWAGVEEDLANSYEQLAKNADSSSGRATFEDLGREAKKNVAALAELRKAVEALDGEQVKRIGKLDKLTAEG